MKLKLIVPVIALSAVLVSCQNQQTKNQSQDSAMMADTQTHAMHDGMSNMQEGTDMMSSMDKMMKNMHQMKMTGNADYDFAMMMKGHHQGAVDMAANELRSGEDATLKQMAQKISYAQQVEIKELDAFMDAHKNPEKNYDPSKKQEGFSKVMEGSMMAMMNMPKMDEHSASSTDRQFVNMMITHHQGAIGMAKGLLQYGKDAKLLSMAKKMIADQNKEIADFNKWNDQHK